ncbi:hypothetical protein PV735_46755 [Streptomyces turgidiscabies]|uniref:hypothetical protein n=1 Tax=Streptomyces turgidiscabies TaxID=85558 RepID=UPI00073EB372|nr:hypothetical protein [Streptomyces turgidiscabies]MDX3500122.1 hypothetical protein [Streptomyces turgidiscabies]GAQ77204.1 hypothetical protein T45_09020 [Streptomyces turgidiscabies]
MKLAELLGSEAAAAQWKNSLVHRLVIWDRLDPNTALGMIERAVAEHDPAFLAEIGQVWTRRFGTDPDLPDVLYLTHWLGSEHLVAEDGGRTGTGVIPLGLLYAYELDYWKRS